MGIKNRNLLGNGKKKILLEDIINTKVSLNTDVMDFLLIAGWNYFWSPLYGKANRELREKIRESYLERNAKNSTKIKIRRGRLAGSLAEPYLGRKFRTLRDLKEVIEQKGLVYRQLGYKGLAEFNKTLSEYNIKPFKLGKKPYGGQDPTKYGLVLVTE